MGKRFLIIFNVLCFISINHAAKAQLFCVPSELSQVMLGTNSNNAVTTYGDCIFSFGGINNLLKYNDINTNCYKVCLTNNATTQLPNLQDTLPVIAAGASTLKGKIYILGGYHVFANGNEVSVNTLRILDPITNQFLPNGAPCPKAIDDQVQLVWRDSLLISVTGWSNNTNVPDVQMYNPSNNTWTAGTSLPNNNFYKAFGACGTIIDDTIYYYGGASLGSNFPAVNYLRKGVINTNNPSQITWSYVTMPLPPVYRGVMLAYNKRLFCIGGSSKSYNYSPFAYNGSGLVANNNACYIINATTFNVESIDTLSHKFPKDLRGVGQIGSDFYLAGGLEKDSTASSKVIKLTLSAPQSVQNLSSKSFEISPNPVQNGSTLTIFSNQDNGKLQFLDGLGRVVWTQILTEKLSKIQLPKLAPGYYFVKIDQQYSTQKLVVLD